MNADERWEQGIEHNAKSVELYKRIEKLDFEQGDVFGFKSGGDGDNGEHLMYLLDQIFEPVEDTAPVRVQKICPHCQKPFKGLATATRYCSSACKTLAARQHGREYHRKKHHKKERP